MQISLNLKKCIFTVPFGTLLGHIVSKYGVCVDPSKVATIVNMKPLRNMKQLRSTLGHTGYYQHFIRDYASITTLMEKLLKKDVTFYCDDDY